MIKGKTVKWGTRLPAWFKALLKKYECQRCMDTGYTGMGKKCRYCDPTTPDREELD